MWFTSYCLSLFLYIISSYLMHYSILYELNTLDVGKSRSMCGVILLDAGRSQSMCGVIVVDAESFRSTCRRRDAYIHDHA